MKTLGQVAFESYNESRGGLTHDGKTTPSWDALGDGVRAGWEAAALAVADRMARADTRDSIGWALAALTREGHSSRELSLVRTKLEEAAMWLEAHVRVRGER